ncbi:2-oxo-4-hydroxy-4-carboxy-5-ureidoimidazoline decarboxylase [Actinomadura flavalba]|uniref:2-oxo-4-hydroxy-4-carboxy-5-ureidoimidazoline decarboxylase n=1 Tax=Actinomadura flavalba TaxID=1120938 RepID=UPI0003811269|nr:2-oxo-4-hydroxy-4-carboxy-5-ureidoimidazoline decarboxylase [Actinomadura flavalba]
MTIERFNALPTADALAGLRACCASEAWAKRVEAERPYADLPALRTASDAAFTELTWGDVAQALSAHPRIGERADGPEREAAWSRGEQSGMDDAAEQTRRALHDGNRAYEERFGHVYLICATGLTPDAMLDALHERLTHDDARERDVVRAELAKIAALRLAKLTGETP